MALDKFTGAKQDLANVDFGATAEADFEAQCTDAIEADDLDHLCKAADGGTVYPTKVADNSILGIILTKQSGGDISDFNNSTDSLEAISDLITAVESTTRKRQAGKSQIFATTIDLAQAAAAYDLATATTADCLIESIVLRLPNVDASDDATITSIKIHTDDTTEQTFVSAVDGATANLTAEAQLAWTGACLLDTGAKIQLTTAGGAADAATLCQVVIKFRAVTDGGYLA